MTRKSPQYKSDVVEHYCRASSLPKRSARTLDRRQRPIESPWTLALAADTGDACLIGRRVYRRNDSNLEQGSSHMMNRRRFTIAAAAGVAATLADIPTRASS